MLQSIRFFLTCFQSVRFSNLAGHDKHGCHFTQRAETVTTAEAYLSRTVKTTTKTKTKQIGVPITVKVERKFEAKVGKEGKGQVGGEVSASAEATIPPPYQSR